MSKLTHEQRRLSRRVQVSRYQRSLRWIARPRVPGSQHWRRVQQRCAQVFRAQGFKVELQRYGTGVNVIGVRRGTQWPAERYLLSAHYDSVSRCPGADDNASGVAGLLEAAVALSGPHKRTLVLACWDEEERGLIGARAYARRARSRNEQIRGHLVFEMIGYASSLPGTQRMPLGFGLLFPSVATWLSRNRGRGDFLAMVGDRRSLPLLRRMETFGARVGLSLLPLVVPEKLKLSRVTHDLRRSDHAPFWRAGYPGVMLTDTSEFRYRPYHCRHGLKDEVGWLNPAFATRVVQTTVLSLHEALNDSSRSPQ